MGLPLCPQAEKVEGGQDQVQDLQTKEAEKRILAVVAAEQSRSFEPCRERDVLAEALGNPEHHVHVRGVSSRQS